MQAYVSTPQLPSKVAGAILNITRKGNRWLKFLALITTFFVSTLIFLSAYLAIWGVCYRLPHSPALLIDTRADDSEPPHFIAICAALAANPHGFPGHAYVAWSDSMPIDFATAESLGFVPMRGLDQIPSLWQKVPGTVVAKAAENNQRNLDAVVVIVDRKTFEKSIEKSRRWKSDEFKVGSSDCVAFADSIAGNIGLRTPDPHNRYPQDYVAQLKILNNAMAARNCTRDQFFRED